MKRTLFNWTKQDKTCKFSRKSSFSSYVQHKNRRKKNSSTYLVSVGCGRLVEGNGQETESLFLCCTKLEIDDFLENVHVLSCFVQLKSVLLISCVFWIILHYDLLCTPTLIFVGVVEGFNLCSKFLKFV